MARARPDWRWVFVGPVLVPLRDLKKLPNVCFLGQRPHEELVKHIRSFNVCIVPYLDNPETSTIVPVKINEYLAAGKPVVSTELPAVREFNHRHDVLITTAPRPAAFLRAIEDSLQAPNGASIIARRREVAATSDWQSRLDTMSRLIQDQLQAKTLKALGNSDKRTDGPERDASTAHLNSVGKLRANCDDRAELIGEL
jgi:glycosyltransferase involved in cell wall biosynthesis